MAKTLYSNVPKTVQSAVMASTSTTEEKLSILNALDEALGAIKAAAHTNNASTIPAAAPAGGVGAAAGAWDTAANRDAAIATINGLRTAVSDLKNEYNSLLAKLRTAGLLSN